MEKTLATCRRLGEPVAPAKCAGPVTAVVFLGFELDTNALMVRLPEGKLKRVLAMVKEWMTKERDS